MSGMHRSHRSQDASTREERPVVWIKSHQTITDEMDEVTKKHVRGNEEADRVAKESVRKFKQREEYRDFADPIRAEYKHAVKVSKLIGLGQHVTWPLQVYNTA